MPSGRTPTSGRRRADSCNREARLAHVAHGIGPSRDKCAPEHANPDNSKREKRSRARDCPTGLRRRQTRRHLFERAHESSALDVDGVTPLPARRQNPRRRKGCERQDQRIDVIAGRDANLTDFYNEAARH